MIDQKPNEIYSLTRASELKSLPLTDNELIRRTQKGDELAFAELIRRYEKRVFNLAYRFLRNEEDAADVLQETFLRAFRHIRKFKEKSSFYTWLYRITLNCALRKLQKKKKDSLNIPIESIELSRGELGIPDYYDTPESEWKRRKIREAVNLALSELPEEWRSVIVLRDMEGLSNKEVAKILKLSVAAVKSRLHRGRIFLRSQLAQKLNVGDSGLISESQTAKQKSIN